MGVSYFVLLLASVVFLLDPVLTSCACCKAVLHRSFLPSTNEWNRDSFVKAMVNYFSQSKVVHQNCVHVFSLSCLALKDVILL